MYPRRMALLRLTAMAALVASALLTYDTLHPDRAFCPLAEACEKARSSALGEIIEGLPTSVLGMLAFGALYLLTLLPLEWSRFLLKPAGALAALASGVFFGYQALVLKTYCPLCLVADFAGLVAGLITLTWPALPQRRSGRRVGGESGASRVAWTLAALLAVVAPFAWPRPEKPSYVEINPASDELFADEPTTNASRPAPPPSAAPASPSSPSNPPGTSPYAQWPHAPPTSAPATAPPAVPTSPWARPSPAPAIDPNRVPPPAAAPPSSPPPAVGPTKPPPAVATPAPGVHELTIVEYLNAYCPHCRATHKRLDKVLSDLGANARRRRVYTWASADYPFWARACAYAQTVGLEERFFEELLESKSQDASEVYAAARRAGLDPQALQQAATSAAPPQRLVKDRQLFTQAGLKGLPTLDIGRRRLMGEQSEAELRSAVQAALAPRR
jgi:predicted DsbA family dithiol-disulfide isomerase/uncharacterized membrane protein